jgi:uncharacterized protein YggE
MFQELYMRRIVASVGLMAIIALAAYTYSTLTVTRYMYNGPTSITVAGKGEVFATPDIATFNFLVEAKEIDAVTAQNKSVETMNAILAYLKESGVAEKDIKTENYNLTPQYEYPTIVCPSWGNCPPQPEPKLVGYQVNQTVVVKIRDTKKAGELVSGVGSKGALNVSGLSFTIDDTDTLKAQAREKAIADAKEKGKVLAQNLGARIVRMNGYWEDEGGVPVSPMYGIGGDMAKAERAEVSPQPAELPVGENTITSRVSISYEIR